MCLVTFSSKSNDKGQVTCGKNSYKVFPANTFLQKLSGRTKESRQRFDFVAIRCKSCRETLWKAKSRTMSFHVLITIPFNAVIKLLCECWLSENILNLPVGTHQKHFSELSRPIPWLLLNWILQHHKISTQLLTNRMVRNMQRLFLSILKAYQISYWAD